MDSAEKTSSRPTSSRLGSLMQSLAPPLTTNYDMLENEDNDSPPLVHPDATHSTSPEPPVRTPSTVRPTPLRHPVPDLQSLQGAYVGNVERLEKTAERLSMKSDIGEELRRIKLEQRQSQQLEPTGSAAGDAAAPASPTSHHRSSVSLSNSITKVNAAARTGGYSPGGYISSPKGSILSNSSSQQPATTRARGASIASRLERVPEPEDEARGTPDEVGPPALPALSDPTLDEPFEHVRGGDRLEAPQDHLAIERPTTAGSTDTYRQATGLFGDFDGVHFSPNLREPQHSRRISLNKPPLASQAQPYKEPPPGEDMVYYPAPVPMMLNLPQRLSKQPPVSEREKRRTQVVSSVPAEARKSAAWLRGSGKGSSEDVRRSAHLSTLPPQLRASAFFDQPPERLDVEVSHDSAVTTLDSILDASAQAPVSAFTDHPIVGHVGAEVYGKPKNRKTSKNPPPPPPERKKNRLSKPLPVDSRQSLVPTEERKSRFLSSSGLNSQTEDRSDSASKATPPRASHEGTTSDEYDYVHVDGAGGAYDDNHGDHSDDGYDREEYDEDDEEEDEDESEEDDEEELNYVGQPTTLLAELQLRKQEQKQRTKTAAVAYPNGMHSTLLQLDAVRQIQHKTRQQRHITLAWEAPENPKHPNGAEEDDEDVPLGVLFPGGNKVVDENRPLGLMEKREMEENEPLSKRRARLRGEPITARVPSPAKHDIVAYTLDIPLAGEEVSDDEEETLAQRVRRLKGQGQGQGQRVSIFGDDFASEMMSQLGGKMADPPAEAKSPPEEETLGQRRKRLQAEAQAAGNPSTVKARRSMADILQAHPVSGVRKPQTNEAPRLNSLQPDPNRTSYGNRLSTVAPMHPVAPNDGAFQGAAPAYPSFGPTAYGNGMNYISPMYSQAGANGFGYGTQYVQESMMRAQQQQEEIIDPRQRDMIDRWRQSVRQ